MDGWMDGWMDVDGWMDGWRRRRRIVLRHIFYVYGRATKGRLLISIYLN
jgi:hypothetical protein